MGKHTHLRMGFLDQLLQHRQVGFLLQEKAVRGHAVSRRDGWRFFWCGGTCDTVCSFAHHLDVREVAHLDIAIVVVFAVAVAVAILFICIAQGAEPAATVSGRGGGSFRPGRLRKGTTKAKKR